jgi:hypothetical protein
MWQKQISHLPGRFWPCTECQSEPRHIEHHGRTKRETLRSDIPATRHSLECRCGRSTGLCITLDAAEGDWGRRYSQMPLDLSKIISNRVARLPRTKVDRKVALKDFQ